MTARIRLGLLPQGGSRGIARALVCTGPHSQVRVYDAAADAAADDVTVYGAAERAIVLTEVSALLNRLVTLQPL
ncbi:hypothetical protein AB0G67_49050 [Streptomyces sp. NPDC021056]|uniref:hypothetical protein n=1 Tax=Streptomyces sp. NPDC021056 TaxID=3155012 RepID=UPI0033F99250